MKKIIGAMLVAVIVCISTMPLNAADSKPAAEKKEAKPRALPFQGKVDSVDQQAKTLKIGERVFHVGADTKITKDGNSASLSDAKAGDQVGISYRQGEDKKLSLVSLRIGPKPETAKEKK